MASVQLALRCEMDLIGDLVADIEAILSALPARHGDRFRALDRRLQAILDGEVEISSPKLYDLGDLRFVVTPPEELCEVVRTARSLGVI